VTPGRLSLAASHAATTYVFRSLRGAPGWAHCTVNDVTGELLITSAWGNWSHRWNPSPQSLGAETLTAFVGSRGDVDYLARKLQSEGRAGCRWSPQGTARELRRMLCQTRLVDGRKSVRPRGEARRPGPDGDPLPYLTCAAAREIWDAIGEVADEVSGSSDLFFDRLRWIDGFSEYVTDDPWEHNQTEQTAGDRALREDVLPALIAACRGVASETTSRGAISTKIGGMTDAGVDWEALVAAVDALGTVMLEMKRRELLGRQQPTSKLAARLYERARTDAEVGQVASRAFEAGTLELVRAGYPDAAVFTCGAGEDP